MGIDTKVGPSAAYAGPHYEDGRIRIGPRLDGPGSAEYVACTEFRCCNGLATGQPSSGKTVFLGAVAMGLKSSGLWRVAYGAAQCDNSRLLNDVADSVAAGPEQILRQLEELEELLEKHVDLKATLTTDPTTGQPVPITDADHQQSIRYMLPSRAYPTTMWIIDDLHYLTADRRLRQNDFVQRLEMLARMGPHFGLAVLASTRSLLAVDFDNSTILRGCLAATNLFAFRSANRSEQTVVSGAALDPSTLPKGGGYCYVAGADQLARSRVAWAPDMARYARELPATPHNPAVALSKPGS